MFSDISNTRTLLSWGLHSQEVTSKSMSVFFLCEQKEAQTNYPFNEWVWEESRKNLSLYDSYIYGWTS